VLRGGRVTADCDPREETPRRLAEMMIGRELPVCRHSEPTEDGAERLALDGLSLASDDPFGTDLKDLRLTVRSGEIVGIAGVAGNGQKALLAALSGERRAPAPGQVRIGGRPAGHLGPRARRARGLAFVPEERLGRGAVPGMTLADNALLTGYQKGMVRHGLVRVERTRDYAEKVVDAFKVVCGGSGAEARSLSGGNLQKFILGREILLEPSLLILAYPTWGVDVGAAAQIRQAVIDLRDRGAGILVVSEELEELFEISDRIAVIGKGRLSPAKRTRDTDVEEVGRWMAGMFAPASDESPQDAA
jgi:simple sugar transport system ATP-binding protein